MNNKVFVKLIDLLKIGIVYIIPIALILNWLLNFHWILEESCIDVFGNPTTVYSEGFPFPSMIEHVCNHEWLGVGYKAINYWFLFLNGIIKISFACLIFIFLFRKIKFNIWQTGLWLLLTYSLFGMYIYTEFKDLSNCGEFTYTKIYELTYNFGSNLYHLVDCLMVVLFHFWYLIIPVCIGLSILIWKSYKSTPESSSKWWILFYFIWILFFTIIITFESYLFLFDDQIITSSGDHTYRQEWYSIIIGYTLIIGSFLFSIKLIRKYAKKGILMTFLVLCLAVGVFIKNQHCIVLGTSGMRFVEFYTPFYENEYIGDFVEGAENPLIDLGEGKWKNKNITKIHTESNKIIFKRPLYKDYLITKQFLFWRFDFPDDFHD